MNKDHLSMEVYIIKGQEYILDYDKQEMIKDENTSIYTLLLFKDNIPYYITFKCRENKCKKNGDEEDEFQKQTRHRNYPLHGEVYVKIREDEVKLIDENPYMKVEIKKEYIKYITNLDEMAKSGIIENIKINKKINSQTPHSQHKLSH